MSLHPTAADHRMIRFGTSGMPPEDVDDAGFLDRLAAAGHGAYELSFATGFGWNEARCERFGDLADERGIRLSIHAPYFAILTSDDEEKARRTRAALEHTMKLGHAMGARVVVAHTGSVGGRSAEDLHALVHRSLEALEPKVRGLGVALGLEVGGHVRAFGTLGDIALIARSFSFVRPVVDWAHVHAMSRGALTSRAEFRAVIDFLRSEFAGWAIDPLHCQFTDNRFGPSGEIMHVPYGEGTLRVAPLVEAALDAGLRMTLISEAHDDDSHRAIYEEMRRALGAARPSGADDGSRPLASGRVRFPEPLHATADGAAFVPSGTARPLRLGNVDKEFFPDGFTKGDLLAYYASVAPLLLPHLADRAIVMSRYPEGVGGSMFYEKQAPTHAPEWLPTAPLWSEHRGDQIDYVTAPDVESLLWIVNLGAIEMHPWLSRVTAPEFPDVAVFDLDPADGADWDQVVAVARMVEVALGRLGLEGFPKTSGATGIHVCVPLDAVHTYGRTRRFVEGVGRLIVSADPSAATMEWDIPRRAGKVFIDHNQNVAGKTIASAYSVRPRAGAPVSTPILWGELDDVKPDDVTIATIWDRLERHGDLFATVLRGGQRLDAAERALGI